MYFSHIDPSQPNIQQHILDSWEAAKKNSQFLSSPDSPQSCWLTVLIAHAQALENYRGEILTGEGLIKKEHFSSLLTEMLQQPANLGWTRDVVFDQTGAIMASRCPLLHAPAATTGARVDILKGVNEVVDHANKNIFGQDNAVLLYSPQHVYFASVSGKSNEFLLL